MIYKLQRKFILICSISVFVVVLLVFLLITAFSVSSMNRNLDMLAERISVGGGRFPDNLNTDLPPKPNDDLEEGRFGFITPETPFATRHFTVFFDVMGEIERVNTESIHAVTEEDAALLARRVIDGESTRGWTSSYRYFRFSSPTGEGIVFVDGSTSRSSLIQSVTITAFVLLGCAALVVLLVVLLSKRVVTPIAESYDKQKQFVTNASHELKTPLTLILANVDIAEGELGKNEWLSDIRTEGERMTALVGQLVALSRMDEEGEHICLSPVPFSDLALDAISGFEALASKQGKTLSSHVEPGISVQGDATLLYRLLSVLLDNAVKYCDGGGEITVSLSRRRHTVLTVENTYAAVSELSLDRLFDRFYRADGARTYSGGYGVGLSLAKAITEKHKGEIIAYRKDATHIGFRVAFKT